MWHEKKKKRRHNTQHSVGFVASLHMWCVLTLQHTFSTFHSKGTDWFLREEQEGQVIHDSAINLSSFCLKRRFTTSALCVLSLLYLVSLRFNVSQSHLLQLLLRTSRTPSIHLFNYSCLEWIVLSPLSTFTTCPCQMMADLDVQPLLVICHMICVAPCARAGDKFPFYVNIMGSGVTWIMIHAQKRCRGVQYLQIQTSQK